MLIMEVVGEISFNKSKEILNKICLVGVQLFESLLANYIAHEDLQGNSKGEFQFRGNETSSQ